MAPHAASRRTAYMADYIADLVRLLAPRPGRLAFAGRLALICALTVLVAEIYQTPEPALATYIVFFLNRDDRALSLILSAVLTLLITVIIGLVIVVAKLVLDDPMWRVISMALISFALLFLTSASKLRPFGSTIALIIGYALDELGLIQVGELGTRALLYAWLFVGIPAGVSMVVNLLLAPPPRRLAERALARRLELAAAMLRGAEATVREQFREALREGAHEIAEWLGLADREKTSPPADIAALRQAAGSTIVLLSAIDVMDRNPEGALPAGLRDYLAKTLDEMAVILKGGRYPTEIVWAPPEGDVPLTPLAAAIVGDIADAIVGFAEPKGPVAPAKPETEKATAETDAKPATEKTATETEKKAGFFAEDAFTNPEHVHYALKTTGAAMFCYVLYSQLDWSGIHTAFLTCYIVSLSTTAETVEKFVLRIAGCLAGAAAGYAAMIFLIPDLTSIGALMIVVFVGALAAGYVAAGSPRISYAGFQMAFAFFLCVIQGPSPAFDLSTARDRVIGILIGNLVVFVVFTNLWPISVGRRIDPAIAALLRRLGTMMTEPDPAARRSQASQARVSLAAIATDLDLAGYEPQAVRPPEAWLSARRAAAQDLEALEGPLLLRANRDEAMAAPIAGRLESLADRFAASDIRQAAPPAASQVLWQAAPADPIIDQGLRRLEQAPI
jgi:multidrug resistance protein MdtO